MAKQYKTAKTKKETQVVVTARQILNGWTSSGNTNKLWSLTPVQMISKFGKNEEWKMWNMDWMERVGYEQIKKNFKGLTKDYEMADGILSPEDYGVKSEEFGNYVQDIVNEGEEGMLPAMFFPIIPPIVNLFVGEYIKRDTRIIVRGVDEFTSNEKSKYKKDLIYKTLVDKAKSKIEETYKDVPESEESNKAKEGELQRAQELVDAELKFKTYETIAEQWANRMITWDNMRFHMKEKAALSFRDLIVTDSTYMHIRSLQDDIQPEVWNPKNVFNISTSESRWASDSLVVGRQLYMSVAEILQNYNHLMQEKDYAALQSNSPSLGINSNLVNAVEGSHIGDNSNWTDFNKPHPESITDSTVENFLLMDNLKHKVAEFDQWSRLGGKKDDLFDSALQNHLFRVTEGYWVSYKKYGTLTTVNESGFKSSELIDEDYRITEEPAYDNSLRSSKTKDNLVSGEHIDWFWKKEIRFGVKISKNSLNGFGGPTGLGIGIYLGGDPIDLQIDKIPVEGMTFSDRNVSPNSMVRRMSPYQICFNIVNNQNIDMLANSLATGKVIMIDQNFIPKKSFDGSWGKNAMNKWMEVIRRNNIALMDGSPTNNPSGTGFSHFQVLDFSNTADILRNIQLGEYYKNMAFSILGITPQRIGNPNSGESATGVQIAQNNSYAQTEYIFERHLNEFMPRVRQLMLDAEQYLASSKPDVRLVYTKGNGENELFEIEGDKLILPKLKLFCQSTSEVKALVEKMQNIAQQINTAGAEMSDYMKIMHSQSPSEIIEQLEKSENMRRENARAKQEADQKQFEESQAMMRELKQAELDNENKNKELDRQNRLDIATINELGGVQTDVNVNKQIDSMENIKEFNRQNNFNTTIDLQKRQFDSKQSIKSREMMMKEKEMVTRNAIEEKKLEIARENKTKSELQADGKLRK